MEVHLSADLQAQLDRLAAETGRAAGDLVGDLVSGYLEEVAGTQGMLNDRYDDLRSGKTKLIDGDEFFEKLRLREEELLRANARK